MTKYQLILESRSKKKLNQIEELIMEKYPEAILQTTIEVEVEK